MSTGKVYFNFISLGVMYGLILLNLIWYMSFSVTLTVIVLDHRLLTLKTSVPTERSFNVCFLTFSNRHKNNTVKGQHRLINSALMSTQEMYTSAYFIFNSLAVHKGLVLLT